MQTANGKLLNVLSVAGDFIAASTRLRSVMNRTMAIYKMIRRDDGFDRKPFSAPTFRPNRTFNYTHIIALSLCAGRKSCLHFNTQQKLKIVITNYDGRRREREREREKPKNRSKTFRANENKSMSEFHII